MLYNSSILYWQTTQLYLLHKLIIYIYILTITYSISTELKYSQNYD